jgi:purine nucleosidase
MVLDTDTYNEIDDQFAVVYSLLSPDKMTVEAIYAAPFYNERSTGPGDGMQKSYQEILRLLERLNCSPDNFVYKGSTDYLASSEQPQDSAAARDLVERAMASSKDDPLYVVAIAAITNVASAILMKPEIIERIVVLWLGGHAPFWPDTKEFNLRQDVLASRLIFDCVVPLIQIPCMGVTTHLLTTVAELEKYVRGKGAIGDFLFETFAAYEKDHFGWSKVIWDIVTIAFLINHNWAPTDVVHSPNFNGSGHLERRLWTAFNTPRQLHPS